MAAPVQAGLQYTVADVKYAAGQLALKLRDILIATDAFRQYLAAQPDADLVLFGLTQAEIDIIKGAYIGEIPGLKTSHDAFTWTKKLVGLGV